ncbi:hypothetical protein D3C87_2058660 [compost metagenome]
MIVVGIVLKISQFNHLLGKPAIDTFIKMNGFEGQSIKTRGEGEEKHSQAKKDLKGFRDRR